MSPGPVGEWLLGFDARELWLDAGSQWDASRRALYLLREDVKKPLSVDASVWPSLFGDGLPESERERLSLQEAGLPDRKGPNAPLWEDLERMRSGLASLGAAGTQPHALIAVGWLRDGRPAEGSWRGGPFRERTVPAVREQGWKFLGFDVADGGFREASVPLSPRRRSGAP